MRGSFFVSQKQSLRHSLDFALFISWLPITATIPTHREVMETESSDQINSPESVTPGAELCRCQEHPIWLPLGGGFPWDNLHCSIWWSAPRQRGDLPESIQSPLCWDYYKLCPIAGPLGRDSTL